MATFSRAAARSPMPRYSICHTTARPRGWQESYESWLSGAAFYGCTFEYILCMDKRWGFTEQDAEIARSEGIVVVWNEGRKCMVDGYRAALTASRGDVLILNSDDMRAPKKWNDSLDLVIGSKIGNRIYTRDFVVQVSSGTPADQRDLMVLQILSRTRMDRLGYALYPAYEGICADDEFSEHARKDGVVLDAKHLLFPHLHPAHCSGVTVDEVYEWQNRTDAYVRGRKILEFRRSVGFSRDWIEPEAAVGLGEKPPSLAIRVYGTSFNLDFLTHWTKLLASLMQRFEISCYWGTASDLSQDWVLTLDSPVALPLEAFNALYEASLERPQIPVMALSLPGGTVTLGRTRRVKLPNSNGI